MPAPDLTDAERNLAEHIRAYGFDDAVSHFPAYRLVGAAQESGDLLSLLKRAREALERRLGLL